MELINLMQKRIGELKATVKRLEAAQKDEHWNFRKYEIETTKIRITELTDLIEQATAAVPDKPNLVEEIAGVLYANKSDEGDEGSWINAEDYYKIANKIAAILPAAVPEPAPVVPMPGIPMMGEKYDEEYHEFLIMQVIGLHDTDARVAKAKKLQTFMVNLASLQWCTGLIEKLEEIEAACNIYKKGSVRLVSIEEIVDKNLHEAYSMQNTLVDNCKLLEKELNLNE